MKKLKDYQIQHRKIRSNFLLVSMQLGDDDASKRLVIHAARRIIQKHKDELNALATK
ncbi:hypothetical protein OHW85_22405 [Acinetobacter baumannii]|nr:hypothetical protein [Acinetobacter baumannii]